MINNNINKKSLFIGLFILIFFTSEVVLSQINDNAPVKIIHRNKSDDDIILIFNEILKEIQKIELRKKIESLEDEVSLNLDENLYTELLTLRNQLKGG